MSVEKQQVSEPLQNEVPFSEDRTKPNVATKAELIADLMRLVKDEPEKFLSRNYYRVHGTYAESAYTSVFGTFAEFKRGANVTPSRHAQNLERHIAKHASVDAYRAMNAEKAGWEGRYLKPDARRWSTDLVMTDVHDHDCDPFWRRVMMDTLSRVQPRRIVIGGDLVDLPEFSRYTQDPREWDVVGRIKWVHAFLAELRAASPDSEIVMIEGNHEARLLKHLAEESVAMRAILSDLHGFTVAKLLGLDRFEINLIARSDLAAFNQRDLKAELNRNYYVAPGNQYLIHHFPEGRALQMPGANGHHHRHFVWQEFSPTHGAYEWHQLGAGHRRHASYCAGEKWGMGFLLLHCDNTSNHVAHEYIQLRDHCVVGGKWYSRSDEDK